MAGGRRSISIGIQPQIALYSVILGGVCALAFYTERYRRDEDEIDVAIQKLYLKDVQEAHARLPQMTATIRGQDARLDDRMNKLVWGGKANMPAVADTSSSTRNTDSDFGESGGVRMGGFGGARGRRVGEVDEEVHDDSNQTTQDDGATTIRVRQRKKLNKEKKRRKQKEKHLEEEDTAARLKLDHDRQRLAIKSTVFGVAVGAVAVAAVTVVLSGSKK